MYEDVLSTTAHLKLALEKGGGGGGGVTLMWFTISSSDPPEDVRMVNL